MSEANKRQAPPTALVARLVLVLVLVPLLLLINSKLLRNKFNALTRRTEALCAEGGRKTPVVPGVGVPRYVDAYQWDWYWDYGGANVAKYRKIAEVGCSAFKRRRKRIERSER
jgi:hypothetical protein